MLARLWSLANTTWLRGVQTCIYNHYGNQYGGSLESRKMICLKIHPITLLGIKQMTLYPTCLTMLTEALFRIAKNWKQLRGPSNED